MLLSTSEVMNAIFRDSLERHSNVCHGCYKTIYTLATTRARSLSAATVPPPSAATPLPTAHGLADTAAPGTLAPTAAPCALAPATDTGAAAPAAGPGAGALASA